ncbi:MAG: DDE-type integrase/transposase/recombinase [bacterium]|nr:DDE-type integrase/transposase/recombinase [bacterium]
MSEDRDERSHDLWARLRFAIVGPLLAAPPRRGQLQSQLQRLSNKPWCHPISGELVRFGLSTIQRWYYKARAAKQDPVAVLRRKRRSDSGRHRALSEGLKQFLEVQYRSHRSWSYQLHTDNLAAAVEAQPDLGAMPSYATVRRYMKSAGMVKQRRRRGGRRALEGSDLEPVREGLEPREVRSFEAEYVHGLWHLDFHHGSLKVLTARGEWVVPRLLGVLDDRSRLVCHAQWYLSETAEDLVHGLQQAFLKRDLPRALLTDNGSAMIAEETRQGLLRLGIHHATTLPYSPYQNGKQEVLWSQVEGRLLAMIENCSELTLALLNEATQAWVEMEYHRALHSETGQTPLGRFLEGPSVSRECPASDELRLAFCSETSRRQRRSDGTLTLRGIRFEIPNRLRHLERVRVRYASWDLAHVYLVDEREGTVLCRVHPLDKTKNAEGRRRRVEAASVEDSEAPPHNGVAPLLHKLIDEYQATGLPPAYLPKPFRNPEEDES